jgi:hypothetical protein
MGWGRWMHIRVGILGFLFMASGVAGAADLALTASWDTFLTWAGDSGGAPTLATPAFTVLDSDGDGRDEIITGVNVPISAFRRIRYSAPFGRYVIDQSVPHPFPFPSTDQLDPELRLVTTLTPGGARKAITWQKHSVAIYDLASGRLERMSDPGGFEWPVPVCAIDLNGDGEKEIILRDAISVRVMDSTLTRELGVTRIPEGFKAWGSDAVCANLDADAAIEVALETAEIFEFNGFTLRKQGSIELQVNGYPMRYVGAANLDGDANEELVVSYEGLVRAYDIESGQIQWTADEAAVKSRIWAARLVDIDQDGIRDLIVVTEPAGPQLGAIIAFDGVDGHELLRIPHGDGSAFAVNAGDFDGDGSIEIAAALIRPFSRPNRLYFFDATTGALEWRSEDELPPVSAAMHDLDHDGAPEIVAVIGGVAGVGDIRLVAFDAGTFAHRWATSHQILPTLGTSQIASIAMGDVDGDGDEEIAVGLRKDGAAQVVIIDGTTRQYVRAIVLPTFEVVDALTLRDLDGNGTDEVIAAASAPYGAAFGGETFILNGASGQTIARGGLGIFQYRELSSVEVGDLNGDGHADIVTAGFNGALGVMDGVTHLVSGEDTDDGHQSLALVDVDGDGQPEIALGNTDGTIDVRRASDLTSIRRLTPCTTAVWALTTNTLPGAQSGDVYYSCDDRVGTANLRAGGFARGLTGILGVRVGTGDVLLATGTAAAPHITTTSLLGLRHLEAGPAVAPYIVPGNNQGGPAVFATSASGQLNGRISFGSFTGGAVQLQLVETTSLGTLALLPQGTFNYTAPTTGNRVDHFTVRAVEGAAQSPPMTFAIIIENSTPVVQVRYEYTVAPGQSLTTAIGAIDPDGDPLTFTLVSQPTMGTVVFNANNTMTYTPASATATGDDSFDFYVSDGWSRSSIGTLVIRIQVAAPPPPAPNPPSNSPSGGGGGGSLDFATLVWTMAALGLAGRCRWRGMNRAFLAARPRQFW